MTSLRTRKLTYSAMLLALAVLMPRVAGLIPEIGGSLITNLRKILFVINYKR